MPEDFGITLRIYHYGILLIDVPRPTAVETVGEALGAIVEARPEGDHRRVVCAWGQPGRCLVINHARFRLHTSVQLLLPEGRLQFRPLDQIATDRMEPRLGPAWSTEIMLTFEKNKAAQFILPSFLSFPWIEPIH